MDLLEDVIEVLGVQLTCLVIFCYKVVLFVHLFTREILIIMQTISLSKVLMPKSIALLLKFFFAMLQDEVALLIVWFSSSEHFDTRSCLSYSFMKK